MVKNVFNNHNEGFISMSNTLASDLANYLSIGIGFGSIIWWGRGIDARLKAVEDWKDDVENRQKRIEEKIDQLAIQTTNRIDDCKKTLYDAIMTLRQ
jgi:hypothetical protein